MPGALAVRKYLGIAWNQDVTAAPYQYTDMSHMLRDLGGSAVATRRGRQQTTQKFNTGKGTFILDNRYMTFESLNTNGPYAGMLNPMVPVQTRLEYPWLPGQVADPLFRTTAGFTAWVGTACTLLQVQPSMDLESGAFTMTATANNTDWKAVCPPILVPAAKIGSTVVASGRFTNQSAVALSVHVEVSFYSNTAGTSLISTVLAPISTNVAAGQPDARNSTGTITVPALTQSMRFRFVIEGGSGGGGLIGQTFKVKYPVLEYSTVDIFQATYSGYSDSWQSTPEELGDNTVTLTCSDMFKAMGLFPMNSPLYGDYIRTGPLSGYLGAWWRLNETIDPVNGANNTNLRFKEEITGTKDTKLDPTYVFNRGPLPGVAGCSPLDTDFGFSFVGPSSDDWGWFDFDNRLIPVTSNWSWVWWMRSPDGIPTDNGVGGDSLIMDVLGPASSGLTSGFRVQLYFANGSGKLHGYVQGHNVSTGTTCGCTFGTGVTAWKADTSWHMFGITYKFSTNTTKFYVDGVLDHTPGQIDFGPGPGVGFDMAGYPNTDARNLIGFGPMVFLEKFETDEMQRYDKEVSAAEMSALYVAARVQYPQETSSARANRVAGLINIPTLLRNIQTTKGVPVTAVTKPFSKANGVQYLQLLEDTEQGMCFIDVVGRLKFIPHSDLIDGQQPYQTPAYTFGNGGGSELPYVEAPTNNDDSLLYTQVAVSREGGVIKYGTGNVQRYFTRQLPLSNLLLISDEAAQNLAYYLAIVYGQLGTRINTLTVRADISETMLAAVGNIEIGHIIKIRTRPQGLGRLPAGTFGTGHFGDGTFGNPGAVSYFEMLAQVQGINHDGKRGPHTVQYAVSTIFAQHWMQFGDNFGAYNMAL